MRHFLLFFVFAPDFESRREQYRDPHLRLAWQASERGELLLAGALTDPVDTGVLLFSTESVEQVEKYAREDPYVVNGLVIRWYVREWATTVGDDASMPIEP
ncbi:YciI-like protein [Burkholderia vietnamiensis]|uniref:YciI-like protein n=1 Tax=Burkholderia vietnamiensis TaxID=60552 RepID=UPI0015945BFE|nr:YciI-like protein [Burkholderia vietnamiensis]